MQETTNRYIEGYQQGYQSGYEKGWLDAKNRISPNDPRYFPEKGEYPTLNSNGISQPLLLWLNHYPDHPFLGGVIKSGSLEVQLDTPEEHPHLFFDRDVFAWIPAPPEM